MKNMMLFFGRSLFLSVFLSATAHALPVDDGDGPQPSRCLNETTIQISAQPAQVLWGESSRVQWTVTVPPRCNKLRFSFNGQAVTARGSRVVSPAISSAFRLQVSETHLGVYGQKSASTQVEVTYLSRVVIDSTTISPVSVLIGALGSANAEQTVELCNVELNLTGRKDILISDNRSLIASPACARGPRNFGPRVFVTDTRGSAALFLIRGDNVRISGFRLEGPTSGIAQGDIKEKGIRIWPFDSPEPIRNIEISNMEVFHWSGVGVEVGDNAGSAIRGRLFNTNPNAVRVKGNFFHHNRHGAGYGYGVSVVGGAYATIEQNVFDENRHGIAGGSGNKAQDYSGYTARDNLILGGGGEHCSEHWVWAATGWHFNCWKTHQIDMHGDQNEWYSAHNWQCGTAGETMIIERNTILYTAGLAIKIRGNPADKVVIDNNVFKAGSRGDAIKQNGYCGWGDNITKPLDVRSNNRYGIDPLAELGSCDFVGDGLQDQFMATGVTWWAKSPVTQQWRYLNTMPERLSVLQLGPVDGDAVCDVAPRSLTPWALPKKYSKGGTSPWIPTMVLTQ